MKRELNLFATVFLLALASVSQVFSQPAAISKVTVLATDPTASEGGGTGVFTFIRSGPTNAALEVNYEVSGTASPGLDYKTLPGAITIPAGKLRATLVLNPEGDDVAEETETVIVTLVPYPRILPLAAVPPAADTRLRYEVGNPGSATIKLMDNDLGFVPTPTLYLKASDPLAAEERNSPAAFQFTRLGATNAALTVSYEVLTSGVVQSNSIGGPLRLIPAATSADYVLSPNPLVIPAGQKTATLQVTPKDDNLKEGWESVTIRLKGTDAYNINPPQDIASVFIEDNDDPATMQPTINVAAVPVETLESKPDGANFLFTRSGNMDYPLEVHFKLTGTARNGTDYNTISNVIVLPPNVSVVRLPVHPIPDKALEGKETIILTLSEANCPAVIPPPLNCYRIGATNKATMTIIETPPNLPPVVKIAAPTDGASFLTTDSIGVKVQAADSDGTIQRLDLYVGEKIYTSSKTDTLSAALSNLPVGAHVLQAVALDNGGASATSAPVKISISAPVVTFEAHINFQPQGTRIPAGYTADNGLVFQKRDSGLAFGWKLDNRDHMVNRNAPNSPDQQHDTFAIMQWGQTQNTWEIAVPNGAYKVHVVAGDPKEATGIFDIRAEGTRVLSGAPTTKQFWIEGTINVNVTDGLLTISSGGDAKTNKICFIDIASVGKPVDNKPPTVFVIEPLSNATFSAGANIAIVAQAADPEGGVLKVEFLEGTHLLGVTTNNPAAANPVNPFHITWTNVAAGAYSLRARATDNQGASTLSEPVPITVKAATGNGPVVTIMDPPNGATFTAPATFKVLVLAHQMTGFITEASLYDGDRLLETQKLNVLVGDPAMRPQITFVVTNLAVGAHSLVAQARNELGLLGKSAPVQVIIQAPTPVDAPQVLIREPLNGARVKAGELKFNVLATDAKGYIIEGLLYRGDALVGNEKRVYIVAPKPGTPSEFSFTVTNTAGTYTFVAQARNDRGVLGKSTPVQITVTNAATQNLPPTVSIASPLDGARALAGTNLVLEVIAQGREGASIAQVEVFANGKSLGLATNNPALSITPNPYRYLWRNVPIGNYLLTAIARDNHALISTSAPVSLTVTEVAGQNVVTVQAQPADLIEGASSVLRFSRTGSLDFALPVFFTISGTAVNGVDYLKITNTVTIPAKSAATEIKIASLTDTLTEAKETIVIKLETPACPAIFPTPPYCYLLGPTNSVTITLADGPNNNNVAPKVEITSPANGASVKAGDVLVRVAATDPDGYIPRAELYANNTLVGKVEINFLVAPKPGLPQTFELNWPGAPAGTFSLTARAIDDRGLAGASAPVRLTITNSANLPPKVTVTSPTNNFQTLGPTNLVLRAEASDPDGQVVQVDFLVGNTMVGSDTTAPYSVTWTNREPGTYSISARATDARGATTLSTPVIVTIKPRLAAADTGAAFAQVNSIRAGADGTVELTLTGSVGRQYELQASSDLVQWTTLGAVKFETGSLTVTDHNSGKYKYYRLHLAD